MAVIELGQAVAESMAASPLAPAQTEPAMPK
jgi:hypothetical protein